MTGDEIHCPHCRRWHRVYRPHNEGTDATLNMLYFDCRAPCHFGDTRRHRRSIVVRDLLHPYGI